MDSEKQLHATVTGEIFQPVRLYYQVFDNKEIRKIFSRLRCVEFDKSNNRWVWLYEKEAKKLKFKKSYSSIPKPMHPIVIDSLYLKPHNKLFVDLR